MINTEPIPQFTPSRVDIENFSSLPLEARNNNHLEANRRFSSTLEALDSHMFLAHEEMGEESHLHHSTSTTNLESVDQEEYMYKLELSERTISEELSDPQVLRFLQQAVALKIHANKHVDTLMVNTKSFANEVIEPLKIQATTRYQEVVKNSYQKTV